MAASRRRERRHQCPRQASLRIANVTLYALASVADRPDAPSTSHARMTTQGTPTGGRYAEAGVDIDAGADLVDRIAPDGRGHRAAPGAMPSLGGFGGLFDLAACGFRDPMLVATTDGVGTKVLLAAEAGAASCASASTSSPCASTTWSSRARSRCSSSTISPPAARCPPWRAEVVAGIAEGCREAGCALIGGETAEMPGLYGRGEYDLAGFAVGAVERDAAAAAARPASRRRRRARPGLVRRARQRLLAGPPGAARAGPGRGRPLPLGRRRAALAEALLAPTRIYVREPASPRSPPAASRRWPTSPAAAWSRTCRACWPTARSLRLDAGSWRAAAGVRLAGARRPARSPWSCCAPSTAASA